MLPIETLTTFVIASALLSFAPGPDNIFVLTQSALRGWRSGAIVTLGLCTGLLVHSAAVVLGVSAIFQASQLAFDTLKTIGVAYLCYLAWRSFHAEVADLDDGESPVLEKKALYRRGILMNVTNPKVAIFFLAFLPQFTVPSYGSVEQQMGLLGGIFIVVALFCFLLIAYLSGFLHRWFSQSPVVQRNLNKIAGIVFLGLAGKLLLTDM